MELIMNFILENITFLVFLFTTFFATICLSFLQGEDFKFRRLVSFFLVLIGTSTAVIAAKNGEIFPLAVLLLFVVVLKILADVTKPAKQYWLLWMTMLIMGTMTGQDSLVIIAMITGIMLAIFSRIGNMVYFSPTDKVD
jgi:hypothetical protein